MNAGEKYNPYRMFYGVFIPEWLARARCVSHGAKLVFGGLGRVARDQGYAEVLQSDLADDLGMSGDACWRWLRELAEYGLIEIERVGLGLPNRYHFLWNEMIEGALVRAQRGAVSDANADADSAQSANPSSSIEDISRGTSVGRQRRRTRVPENFVVTEAMRTWAADHVPSVNISQQTHQFLDHHRAKDSLFKDWNAAWRTWMRNAADFQRPSASPRGGNLSKLANA